MLGGCLIRNIAMTIQKECNIHALSLQEIDRIVRNQAYTTYVMGSEATYNSTDYLEEAFVEFVERTKRVVKEQEGRVLLKSQEKMFGGMFM